MEFKRTTKRKVAGGQFRTALKESLFLDNISASGLGTFWSLISDWQNSRSRPAITDSLNDVSGTYEKTRMSTGRSEPPQNEEFEFSSLGLAIGTAGFIFIISGNKDSIRFNIPASEVPGRESKYTNISKLGDLIYDFFEIEYEGNVHDLELDLPPEIEASERLDEELQRRAITEFRSQHFQSSVRTAFTVLEERIRECGDYPETEYGAGLIQQAFHTEDGQLTFGASSGERDGVMFLYRGAFQALRNPASHRFIEAVDEDYARDAIFTVNLLLRLLKENHASQSDTPS